MTTHKNIPEFLDDKRDEGLRWRTIRLYGQILLRFRDQAPTDINTLSEAQVKAYLRGIGGAGSHRRTAATVLKAYYDWLAPAVNPMAGIKRQKPPAPRDLMPITDEEFIRVKNAASPRIRDLIWFLALTGLRISEALYARAADFELSRIEGGERRPTMKVRGKGGKVLHVPLVNPGLVRWLAMRLKTVTPREVKVDGQTITVDGPFAGLTYGEAWDGIHKAAKRAGVQKRISDPGERPPRYYVSPHVFRRYAATSMLERGVAPDVVQTVLRHSSIEMTMRYARTREKRVWKELRANQAMRGQTAGHPMP
jgi:integrase